MLALVVVFLAVTWISPGMREHEEEFRQAWVAHFGTAPGADPMAKPPPATYKAWYKQFKKTGIGPVAWIATLGQGPPTSSMI